jgi:ubiquinone/menaquinone biosynthesis C-methylase UbiE
MHTLPFKDGEFDVVTSWYALQAATDTRRVLEEMLRVTRPGGTVLYLAKHPIRSMLEGRANDGLSDYFSRETVTSKIFDGAITLREPNHTLADYFDPSIMRQARLEAFHEGSDFPASQSALQGLRYPTYLVMRWRKDA